MSIRKRLLLVALPLLLVGAGIGGYVYLTTPADDDVDTVTIWEPKLPATASTYTLPHEESGELWRKSAKSADGKLTELRVGYADGRLGVYTFDKNEKVSTFTCYSADDTNRMVYQSWFGADGLTERARSLRADGTLESEYRRQIDGTEVRDQYSLDGTKVETSVTTLLDGSQRSAKRGADGKVEVSELKAEPKEVSVGQRLAADGTYTPAFKVRLTGARVTSWEYFDTNGKLRHRGKFNADGTMVISLINDDGDTLLTQYWKRTGDDWNRAYYRVEMLEIHDPNRGGQVTVRAKLNPDGITPSTVEQLYDGRVQQKQIFDSKGFNTHVEYNYGGYGYPYGGGGTNVQEIPPAQRRQLVLPPHLVGEPAGLDPKLRVYRLRGTPFAQPAATEPAALPALFIAP